MLAGIILCGSGLVIHRPGYAQLSGGLIQTAQTCLPTGFNGPFRALRFAQNRQKNSATQRKGPDWPFAMCSVRDGLKKPYDEKCSPATTRLTGLSFRKSRAFSEFP